MQSDAEEDALSDSPVIPALPVSDSDTAESDAAEESDVEHFTFHISKHLTRRIDQYLVDRLPYLSRAAVQRIIDEKLVKVNGRFAKASYRPRMGDNIEMVAPPKPISELVPENIPLDIVYEDEHFIALNKQTDLIVHPARGRWTGTLVNGLVYYGKKWSQVGGDWRPGILHRLDKNTTGIMLVAKSDEAHWRLARQFENRTIQKTYLSICHGVPELLSDVIDRPIGKDRYIREKQAVRSEANGGKQAITIYEVKEIFNRSVGLAVDTAVSGAASPILQPSRHAHDRKNPPPPEKFSLIRLSPKTGRTHQLRVHLSAIGHPMVGDTMYGGRIFRDETGVEPFTFERQALHAYEITFVHPATLETMTLQAPLPPDIMQLAARLRVGEESGGMR
jgi:23S rRNA pseudouridine1911/1915/1917 synthase